MAGFGECRRYPPKFPTTSNDDWCGEFNTKERCSMCFGELTDEYLYNPNLVTAFAQSLEGRICRSCFESLKAA
jgi:hypothetical protein